MVVASVGEKAVPPITNHAILVDKTHRGQTEIYDSRAKLEGGGFGVCTKASADGWAARYFSSGEPAK